MLYQEAQKRIKEAGEKKLTELDLNLLGLKSLPPELFELEGLERLDIRGNNLTSLPPEIGRLAKLEYLDVSHNRLTSLPREIVSGGANAILAYLRDL